MTSTGAQRRMMPRLRLHPRLIDLCLALVAFPMTVLAFSARFSGVGGPAHLTARDAAFAAAATVPLLFRRDAPVTALGAVLLACGLYQGTGGMPAPIVPPLDIAVYGVAVRTSRRGTVICTLLAVACCVGPALFWGHGPLFGPLRFGALTWLGLAAAIGDSVRTRHAHVQALEQRATRAELGRDEEAARRVAAERMRIARELHDVVAHELTLINTQAAVSIHLGQRDPDALAEVLTDVRDHSKLALDELRTLVGLLTEPGENPAPREPVPGLHRLDALVDSFAKAGLRVEVIREGEGRELPAAVDVAGYRIIQEALTNVRKHGAVAAARVRLGFERDALRITVQNEGRRGAPVPVQGAAGTLGGSGRGLIGIRERVAAVGGQIVSGPRPAGGFTVDASLPLVREPAPRGARE
jgi:signal transduction histidine kinase